MVRSPHVHAAQIKSEDMMTVFGWRATWRPIHAQVMEMPNVTEEERREIKRVSRTIRVWWKRSEVMIAPYLDIGLQIRRKRSVV